MTSIPVRFVYRTGLRRPLIRNARLAGSWDSAGRYSSDAWFEVPMASFVAEDGCEAFAATVNLVVDDRPFHWGVRLDSPAGTDLWGIVTEAADTASNELVCSFLLPPDGARDYSRQHEETYSLCQAHRLGANALHNDTLSQRGVRFSAWAPNAKEVAVVIGRTWRSGDTSQTPLENLPPGRRGIDPALILGGYISDDGDGVHPQLGPFPLIRRPDGVWETDPSDPRLADFATFDHLPYMFRIVKDDGQIAYRTDLYARCQIGAGAEKPTGRWTGRLLDLDGGKGCSAVIDPARITRHFAEPVYPEQQWVTEEEFWANEFDSARPVPDRIEDLVIYELHLGALGFENAGPGTVADAMALLDHIAELGVNAVELLPMAEYGGGHENWGYATSHYFAIEYGGGGRDKFKLFVRECHRRGIAVIMDVVYNHYVHDGERAQWMYDTNDHRRNAYYWYEGEPQHYPDFDRAVDPQRRGTGGYVDNLSTGWAPRYHEPMVRQMFRDMGMILVEDFHVDGFRVDQTTSIHAYNVRHADGQPVPGANVFGARMLREWSRALRLIRPGILLMAEDHSGWDAVTRPTTDGGLGFDAAWHADFYHHLVGDANGHDSSAKLLKNAGYGDDRPLAMDRFAGALAATGSGRVVYAESHDEAGNGAGTARNMVVAVNGAPLLGETRRFAEARCRCAFGITVFSAGVPLFLFGEEVGAAEPFLYDGVLQHKPDLHGMREGIGGGLYRFYSDAIKRRLDSPALRSRNIEIVHVHNENRVIAFRRWIGDEQWLVVASLNNRPFEAGYELRHHSVSDGGWREVFNSDASAYGGDGVGNGGSVLTAQHSSLAPVLPANGILLLQRQ